MFAVLNIDNSTRDAIFGAICLQPDNAILGQIENLTHLVSQLDLTNPICDVSALTNLISQGIQATQQLINATDHATFCRFVFRSSFLSQRHK